MKILFVCSGNTCRSPLAEALARREAAKRGMINLEFTSAGTGALDGGGASEAAILVALERGIDLSGHRTRALTPGIVADADLVLVMSPSHLDNVRMAGPAKRAVLLDSFTSDGKSAKAIEDPFGGTLEAYRAAAAELERQIGLLLHKLQQR